MICKKIKMSIAETARLKILIGIVLSILVLVSYWGVVENDFIGFDDPQYVTENPSGTARLERGDGGLGVYDSPMRATGIP